MKRKLLGYTKDRVAVTYDPIGSHVATHFQDTPDLKALVLEIIENTVTTSGYMA